MLIRWYGQSAFLLTGEQSVFIDPFGDMSMAAARGLEFNYPPIEGVTADLLLVTHEHGDHNGVEAIGGDPVRHPFDGRAPRVAGRRGGRRRLRARRRRRHPARPELDRLLLARRASRLPPRRLRSAGAPARAAGGDRRGRRPLHPGRRRPDDRRGAGGRAGSLARARASSSRCTTGPRRSTSSSRRTRSSKRSAHGSNGSRRARPRSRICSAPPTSRSSRYSPCPAQ